MNKKIIYGGIAIVVVVVSFFALNVFLKKQMGLGSAQWERNGEFISINNLVVPSQASEDDIYVERVLLRTDGKGGFVVIYREKIGGGLGDLIGVSEYINPGATRNILVALNDDQEVRVGETVFALLYADNGNKEWDPEKDTLIMKDDGTSLSVSFQILDEKDLPGYDRKPL